MGAIQLVVAVGACGKVAFVPDGCSVSLSSWIVLFCLLAQIPSFGLLPPSTFDLKTV